MRRAALRAAPSLPMVPYAAAIFLSAFLLFQVQLVAAREILPWFGGSAAVWTTCMLFFQSVLVLGYLYANWSVRRLGGRAQAIVHAALLAASLAALPVVPRASFAPAGAGDPSFRILVLLAATVGAPYFALSATSPLLQAWYARRRDGAAPYRLFALSNLGSMLGLLSYPAAVEPFLPVRGQALAWSLGYVAFAVLCAAIALAGRGGEADPGGPAAPEPADRTTTVFWVALPACASVLLLAVTNHLTQNVAAIPFLWVLPLSLYLLSFILCFSRGRWYRRTPFLLLFFPALAGMAWLLGRGYWTAKLALLIPVYAGGLFVCCMICHGELARTAPHPRRLTAYYLWISLGGAAGGLFVGVLAPLLFSGYYELPAGLVACAVAVLAALFRAAPGNPAAGRRRALAAAAALFTLGLAAFLASTVRYSYGSARLRVRNFYGALAVYDADRGEKLGPVRTLVHGTITHGKQFLRPDMRRRPTAYYGPDSGVALAIRSLPPGSPRRLGVVGLGAGTLAAYARAGDSCLFYEINPLVIRIARRDFSFLGDSPAAIDVVPGDARLSLAREAPRRFDLLAIDAFSGDSVPVHLLTREAFELYFRHLRDGGILAVHVSNKYLDLEPVVRLAAEALGKEARQVDTEDDEDAGSYGSNWILLSGDPRVFEARPFRGVARRLAARAGVRTWTDDYSNLFRILK